MWVIPAIDLIGGECVRLYQGDYSRQTTYQREAVEQALKFQAAGFRRLHLVDLEGARSGAGENRAVIERVIKASKVPVQVGGGIRTSEDVESLLGIGASYLIIGTVVLEQPEEFESWIERWDASHLIPSLDLKENRLQSRGWLKSSGMQLEAMVARLSDWGTREVICTDVERDGTLAQPNYSTYQKLRKLLPEKVDLLAAGGVSAPQHLRKLKEIGVGGAIIGRAMYEGSYSWEDFLQES